MTKKKAQSILGKTARLYFLKLCSQIEHGPEGIETYYAREYLELKEALNILGLFPTRKDGSRG